MPQSTDTRLSSAGDSSVTRVMSLRRPSRETRDQSADIRFHFDLLR